MGKRVVAPTMLVALLVAGALSMAAAGAAPKSPASACTAAQKAQRQATLAVYRKRIGRDRKAYFAHHRSAKLRQAFVHKQQARLAKLVRDAACTVAPPSPAAQLTSLRTFVGDVKGLGDLFDPSADTIYAADQAMATLLDDEDTCDTDPELPDCPVPLSEYQDAAKALRTAATQLKQGSTKLAAAHTPIMAVTDYTAASKTAAGECGFVLTTVASSNKKIQDAAAKWATRLGTWADTYAKGKSPDFDAVGFTLGSDSIADDSRLALVDWAVTVSFYWSSLVEKSAVKAPPELPAWIADLREEECPTAS